MDNQTTVDERMLGWSLGELLGGQRPGDLAAVVVARARAGAVPRAWPSRRSGAARWPAAALIVIGIGAIVGTALLRPRAGDRLAVQPQQPAPAAPPQESEPVIVHTAAELAALPPLTVALRVQGLTAAEFELLPSLPQLEALDLSLLEPGGMEAITAATLQVAARSPALRVLLLDGHREVQGEWLARLGGLARLERLGLAYVQGGAAAVANLAKLPSLRHLDLAMDQTLTDADVKTLAAALPGLRSLSLRGCGGLHAEGLQCLRDLRQLELLDLGWLTGVDLGSKLATVQKPSLLGTVTRMLLAEVTASGAGQAIVGDELLTALAASPKLQTLRLAGSTGVTAAGWKSLTKSLALRELVLDDTKAGDELLADLPVGLRRLGLARTLVSDAGLKLITDRFVELEALDVTACRGLTDAGLLPLLAVRAFKALVLRGCSGLSAATVEPLLLQHALEELDVSGCKWVDDAAARQLAALPRMRKFTNQRGGNAIFLPK